MLAFITAVYVVLCVFMIFVILLQPGKDAGMGSALGGGAATSAFGGRGAVTFLSKVTAACAVLFFILSLALSFVGLKRSVAEDGDESVAAGAVAAADAGTPVTSPVSPTPAPPVMPAAPVSGQ